MKTQEQYLVNIFKNTNKQNDTICLKRKKDKYCIYAFKSYDLCVNEESEIYKEILNAFDFHGTDDHNLKLSFKYKNFDFIVKIFHLNDSYLGEDISIRYYIYSDNFKNFIDEFGMAFNQIEASLNKKLERQKQKIENANKKINMLENFINVSLAFI